MVAYSKYINHRSDNQLWLEFRHTITCLLSEFNNKGISLYDMYNLEKCPIGCVFKLWIITTQMTSKLQQEWFVPKPIAAFSKT